MDNNIKSFIQQNIGLIDEDTKNSWEQFYKNIDNKNMYEVTYYLLDAGIDPSKKLGYIPSHFLYQNPKIYKYFIPTEVEYIEQDAFFGCINLNYIEFNDNVKVIGDRAFSFCTDLKDINILNVQKLGLWVFKGCHSLKSVQLKGSHITIGHYCFSECNDLETFKIDGTVEYIHQSAFYKCINLRSIIFNGTCAEWKAIPKNEFWDSNSSLETIECIDGVMYLYEDN